MNIDLLKELTEAHGVSGREEAIREICKRELGPLGELSFDSMGDVICTKRGSGNGKKVMIAAHMVWGATLGFALKALSAGQPNLRSAQRAPRAPPRTIRHDLKDVGARTATSKQGHAHGST